MRRILLMLALCSLAATALAGDYGTPYGEWRGQTQYQAFVKGVSDPAAHVITNLTVKIDPGGKVEGASTENGCRLLGLAAPGLATTVLMLDVTVTGCRYAGLNRTYIGHLTVYAEKQYASLSLQAVQVTGTAGTFNITSTTMRR